MAFIKFQEDDTVPLGSVMFMSRKDGRLEQTELPLPRTVFDLEDCIAVSGRRGIILRVRPDDLKFLMDSTWGPLSMLAKKL